MHTYIMYHIYIYMYIYIYIYISYKYEGIHVKTRYKQFFKVEIKAKTDNFCLLIFVLLEHSITSGIYIFNVGNKA